MNTAVERLRVLPWSPGYDEEVWEAVLAAGTVHACHAAPVPGPHGDCWRNARAFVDDEPDRYSYIEGVVTSPGGRLGRGWWIQPRFLYPHAWVNDRHTGQGIETTVGWSKLTPSSTYVGLEIPWGRVSSILATARQRLGSVMDTDAGNVSILELGRLLGA